MGRARALACFWRRPRRQNLLFQIAHQKVTCPQLRLSGEGARQHTRGRVCSPIPTVCSPIPTAYLRLSCMLGISTVALAAAEIDESKLPPPAQKTVDFDADIRPLFEGTCLRCHGTERPKSRFSLATRETALKGGEHGVDIIPGQSAKSPLIHYVARL